MHCPHLDLLRQNLIEAYRSLDDNLVAIAHKPDASDKVFSIHQVIAEHRQGCPICSLAEVTQDGFTR